MPACVFFGYFKSFVIQEILGQCISLLSLRCVNYETRSSKQEQFKNIDRQSTFSQQKSKVQSFNIYYSVIKKGFPFGCILERMSIYQ